MNRVAVELEQQVVNFVRSLPPQPRQALRRALKNMEWELGDIRALEGDLVGFTGFAFSGIESFSPTRFETVGESSGTFTLLLDLSCTRFLPKGSVTYWTKRDRSGLRDHAMVVV